MSGVTRHLVRAASAALLLVAAGGTALAQAVVVRATGPSATAYPAGKKLAANAKVDLKAGDVVTIIDQAGSRVLRGKGSFTVDSKVARDSGAVALLTRSLRNPQTVRAGAVRSGTGGGKTLPSSIWSASIDRGGKVCVPQGSDLYLWRDDSEARRYSWLGEAEGGGMVRLQWPPRTAGIAWPTATLPLIGGRSYRVSEDVADANSIDFDVVMLEPDMVPNDPAGLAVMLLDKGCEAQFEQLAAMLQRMGPAS